MREIEGDHIAIEDTNFFFLPSYPIFKSGSLIIELINL